MGSHSVLNQDLALVGKKCRNVPTRRNCRNGVGEKRSSSCVKQSPSSETGQVKKFRETIVLLQEGHRRKSPEQVNWSLLRPARCLTACKHGLIPGKTWAEYAWRKLQNRTLRMSGKKDAQHTLI